MRHNKSGESVVMQEFERIAAEKGWMTKSAQDFPAVPEHIPTHLVKQPQGGGAEPPTTMRDIDKMLAGVKGPVAEPAGYHGTLVQEVQQALMAAKEDVGPYGPDGKWGWFTAKAWNAFAKKNPQLGLPQATETQPPSNALMRKMLGAASGPAGVKTYPAVPEHIPMGLVKEPHMTEPWQYPTAKEMVPKASLAIVDELVALANDLDEMGETKVAEAVDEQLRLYKSAVDKLYDITGETGEQLIGEAHPGGGPTMVPAKDEGGKVETIVEEQKRNMEVARKQPTGKQAAFVAKQLVALANRLDAEGKREAALLVDKALDELREGSRRPFVVEAADAQVADRLGEIFSAMDANLNTIEGDVKNQWAVLGGLGWGKPKEWQRFHVSDPYGEPHEDNFDDFVMASRRYVRECLYDSEAKASDPKGMARVSSAIAGMVSNLSKVRRFYKTEQPGGKSRKAIDGDWTSASDKALGEIVRLSTELTAMAPVPAGKPSQAPTAGGPAPAAAKTEDEFEKIKEQNNKDLLGTVERLLRGAMSAGGKEGAVKKIMARHLRGGEAGYDALVSMLEKMRTALKAGKRYDWRTAQKYNRWLYGILAALKGDPALQGVFAHLNSGHRKMAEDLPDPSSMMGKPTGKAPAGASSARRPSGKKSRPELVQLQNAMMAVGIPLPKHQADGKWGLETWTAWNTLKDSIIARRGPDIGRPPAPNTEGPSAAAIGAATNLAKRLGRLQSAQATVAIAPGVRVSEQALSNAQAFMKALSAQPASGVNAQDPPKAQAAAALKVVQSYRQALEQEDSQEAWALSREGVDPRTRIAAVDGLIAQLRAVGTGIPSYRMEGGQDGSGRFPKGHPGYGETPGRGMGEREIGEFGTLGGGRGGREWGRTAPAMSLEDSIYNVPDVSGFVNDPMQFAEWARRYWMRVGDADEASRGNAYAVAHKVVAHLRRQIAILQDRLMRAPVRNRAELETTLRQRHEALNDMYTVLPKGR